MKVTAQDVSTEGLKLGIDEVDSAFISQELFKIIPSTLLYELMIAKIMSGTERLDSAPTLWTGV